MPWTHTDIPDQTGRTTIITGANSGIGFETARSLVQRGGTVILACRNVEKGNAALAQILADVPEGKATVMALDLSSLDSVQSFADAFASTHEQLHLLINNAGVMVPPQSTTADGFELQFGTNHLGHFALTGRLLPLLLGTEGSRVVTLSSIAHRQGTIDFENLGAEKGYSPQGAYGQSKLANLLFTRELQRRLEEAGQSTLAVAAHPGWTATNLQKHSRVFEFLNRFFAQEPPDGALPTLYAATASDVRPNAYYGPSKRFETVGPPAVAKRTKAAEDDAVAQQLWAVSEKLTGVTYAIA